MKTTQVFFSGQNNIIVTANMTISCTGQAAAMNLQKKIQQQNINIKIISSSSSLMKSLKNTNNNIVGHQLPHNICLPMILSLHI